MGNYNNLSDWAISMSNSINGIKNRSDKIIPFYYAQIIDKIDESYPELNEITETPQLIPYMQEIANSIRRRCSCVDCKIGKKIAPNNFPDHIDLITLHEHRYELKSALFNDSPYGEFSDNCVGSAEDWCYVTYYQCECGHLLSTTPETLSHHKNNCQNECTVCGTVGGTADVDLIHNFEEGYCTMCGISDGHEHVWSHSGDGYYDSYCIHEYEYCTLCGKIQNYLEIPHDYVDGKCSRCGATDDQCGSYSGCIHDFSAGGDSNYDSDGNLISVGWYCSNCGTGFTCAPGEDPPSYVPDEGGCDWRLQDTYPATCISPGYKIYSCLNCGRTKTEAIPTITHDLTQIRIIHPTCTSKGYTIYKCSYCNNTFNQDYVDMIDHDFENVPAQEATCQQIGWKAYKKCKNCDHTEGYEEIPQQDHSYVGGSQCVEGYCGWCEDACPHENKDYSNNDIDWECLDCGYIPHNLTSVAKVDPTCTEDGNTEGEVCSYCDYSTVEVLSALGHDTYTISAYKAPTCTESGRYARTKCSRCQDTFGGGTIPALNHTGGTATCTTKAVCTRCSQEYGSLNSNNHAGPFRYNVTSIFPTCKTTGTAYDICDGCHSKINTHTLNTVAHRYTTKYDDIGAPYKECEWCGDITY